jgi:peptide/nickel transport system permease protein
MTIGSESVPSRPEIVPALRPARRGNGGTLNWLRQNAGIAFAGVIGTIFVLTAIFGNVITPYSPSAANFGSTLLPPAWEHGGTVSHLLGSDQLGRDILSRLIAGTRISLLCAGAAIFVAGVGGTLLGLLAGYIGGVIGAAIMRVVDAFLALPFILMALAFVAALGPGLGNIILVLIFTNWARYARVVQSEVISIKERDYVTLARVAGVSPFRIAIRHILPNAMNSVAVLAILDSGRVIILESSLSFLGLGIQPPNVSWGLMLADGREYMNHAWWMTTLPGLTIVIAVLTFNVIGEWLKQHLDPRGQI